MRFRRSEDQENIAEGDLVRLLPTMIYTPSMGNPVGAIGSVSSVGTFMGEESIHVKWFFDVDLKPIRIFNSGYRMHRDLEKMIMYVKSDTIKYNNKEVVIL